MLRKKLPLILIIVLSLFVYGFLLNSYKRVSKIPKVVPSVISPEVKLSKKTYQNNELHISFDYPNNIVISEKINQIDKTVQIEFKNLENKSVLFIGKSTSNLVDKSQIINIQKQTYNGIEWKNLQPTGQCYSGECEIPFFLLETTKNGYTYTFKVEYSYIEPDLDLILSTFKFSN